MVFRWLLVGLFFVLVASCDRDEGVTPLMIAAKDGDAQIVARLLGEGHDPNETSAYGWTPLMFAAWQGQEEVTRILVESGADINLRSDKVPASLSTTGDHPQTTALTEAISNGHVSLARFLLTRGAVVDPYSFAVAGGRADPALLTEMAEQDIDIDAISDIAWHRTALSAAARAGNVANMAWLIEHGADVNLPLPNTSNLTEAIRGGQLESVRMLIAAGADPNRKIGSLETSPLWEAIYSLDGSRTSAESIEIIEVLLRHGADVDYRPNRADRTMVEHMEHSLSVSEERSRDPAYDTETQRRYLEAVDVDSRVLALLKSYGG